MKYLRIGVFIAIVVITALLLAGCADDEKPGSGDSNTLAVTGGDTEKMYTREDLAALPVTTAAFGDVGYAGVQLTVLLEDAGFDPADIRVVKATASDGFSANYEAELFTKADTIVAYEQANGDVLSDDDGTFRMVLPGQEGKLNPRHLTEIQVILK